MKRYKLLAITASVFMTGCLLAPFAQAQSSRDNIAIVGSSTVYPFTTTVAEQFGRQGKFKTPKVESTGTGGGIKLFCNGVGTQYPDIANASRRMKAAEFETCKQNGVKDIVEIKIGYDGITMSESKGSTLKGVTRKQVYLALAKQIPDPSNPQTLINNPYKTWRDVDSSLPNVKICSILSIIILCRMLLLFYIITHINNINKLNMCYSRRNDVRSFVGELREIWSDAKA